MHVAVIQVRCKSGVLVAKPTPAWPPPGREQPRAHSYRALRPQCSSKPRAALEALGLEDSYPMDLGGEAGRELRSM
eukprot:364749-Chlamydomonas_euryale.AAC.2